MLNKSRIPSLLAVICSLIPVSIQIVWLYSFFRFDDHQERISRFLSFFPYVEDPLLLVYTSIFFALISIVLNAYLLKEGHGLKRTLFIALLALVIVAFILSILGLN